MSVYFISVVSCIGCRGWFLWEDSCKDEFFDGDEEVGLEVWRFWRHDGVLMLFGGYLIRLTFVEFGLLAVETLEMGVCWLNI